MAFLPTSQGNGNEKVIKCEIALRNPNETNPSLEYKILAIQNTLDGYEYFTNLNAGPNDIRKFIVVFCWPRPTF